MFQLLLISFLGPREPYLLNILCEWVNNIKTGSVIVNMQFTILVMVKCNKHTLSVQHLHFIVYNQSHV
jgi:phospholipid N-methyltransferase